MTEEEESNLVPSWMYEMVMGDRLKKESVQKDVPADTRFIPFTTNPRNAPIKEVVDSEPSKPEGIAPPACRSCKTAMTTRHGAFGYFYYCPNRCETQKTISHEWWRKNNDRSN